MARWINATHGADLRNRVEQGQIRIDDLSTDALWKIGLTYYPETISKLPSAKSNCVARFRKLFLRIREERAQQGVRRRAGGEEGMNSSLMFHRPRLFLSLFIPCFFKFRL